MPINNRSGVSPNAGIILLFRETRAGLFDHTNASRNNSWCVSIDTGPSYITVTAGAETATADTEAWFYVVIYRRGNTIGISCNGEAAPREYTHAELNVNLGIESLKLFEDYTTNHYYLGTVDQVAIWDRAITVNEIAELYNNGAGNAHSAWGIDTVLPDPPIFENYIVANDSGAYEAWPQIAKDSNGKLYIVYRTAASNTHMYESTGKVVMKISTDNGVTWGSEIVVADETAIDDRNMSILIF